MADILTDFPVKSSARKIFAAVSTPEGLDAWWTKRSSGRAEQGEQFELWFGPEHDWRAVVSRCVTDREFELEIVSADKDWLGTRLGFLLEGNDEGTQVHFHHVGWPKMNEHYRVSCYCWPMYLRLLRRYVERGEVVPYEDRLDV